MRFPSEQEVDCCHFPCRTQPVHEHTHTHTHIGWGKTVDVLILTELIYMSHLSSLCLCLFCMCKCNMTYPDFQDFQTIGGKSRLMLGPYHCLAFHLSLPLSSLFCLLSIFLSVSWERHWHNWTFAVNKHFKQCYILWETWEIMVCESHPVWICSARFELTFYVWQ